MNFKTAFFLITVLISQNMSAMSFDLPNIEVGQEMGEPLFKDAMRVIKGEAFLRCLYSNLENGKIDYKTSNWISKLITEVKRELENGTFYTQAFPKLEAYCSEIDSLNEGKLRIFASLSNPGQIIGFLILQGLFGSDDCAKYRKNAMVQKLFADIPELVDVWTCFTAFEQSIICENFGFDNPIFNYTSWNFCILL